MAEQTSTERNRIPESPLTTTFRQNIEAFLSTEPETGNQDFILQYRRAQARFISHLLPEDTKEFIQRFPSLKTPTIYGLIANLPQPDLLNVISHSVVEEQPVGNDLTLNLTDDGKRMMLDYSPNKPDAPSSKVKLDPILFFNIFKGLPPVDISTQPNSIVAIYNTLTTDELGLISLGTVKGLIRLTNLDAAIDEVLHVSSVTYTAIGQGKKRLYIDKLGGHAS